MRNSPLIHASRFEFAKWLIARPAHHYHSISRNTGPHSVLKTLFTFLSSPRCGDAAAAAAQREPRGESLSEAPRTSRRPPTTTTNDGLEKFHQKAFTRRPDVIHSSTGGVLRVFPPQDVSPATFTKSAPSDGETRSGEENSPDRSVHPLLVDQNGKGGGENRDI